jgi:hypothetical protein
MVAQNFTYPTGGNAVPYTIANRLADSTDSPTFVAEAFTDVSVFCETSLKASWSPARPSLRSKNKKIVAQTALHFIHKIPSPHPIRFYDGRKSPSESANSLEVLRLIYISVKLGDA